MRSAAQQTRWGAWCTISTPWSRNIQRNGESVTTQARVSLPLPTTSGHFWKTPHAVQHIKAMQRMVLSSTNTTLEQLQTAATSAQVTSESAAKNSN